MPKRTSKGKKVSNVSVCHSGSCEEHIFSLKPISNGLASRLECRLEFCPKYNSFDKKFRSLLPMLNRDGKEYTPCFILDGDQIHYSQYEEKYKQAHVLKVKEYIEASNKTIPNGLPISLHPFNQPSWNQNTEGKVKSAPSVDANTKIIEMYKLYIIQHINSVDHKRKIRMSPFNSYIEQLVQDMKTKANQREESEAKDYSQITLRSTCSNLSSQSYVPKKYRKEMKMREKEIEKNNRWLGQLPSYKCCSVFVREGIEAEDCRTTNLPATANKSFQVEDYLNLA